MVLSRSFEIHLKKIETLMSAAAESENPALYLFENDARTPFFMLEALARLSFEFYEKSRFEKLLIRFKAFEDLLGAIDYADEAGQELAKVERVPSAVLAHFQYEKQRRLDELTRLLQDEHWLDGKRVAKIRKKLAKADFASAKREIKMLEKLYSKLTDELCERFEGEIVFTDVEKDVHELRRDLRWLSIYPHAVPGAIRLSGATKKPAPELRKYLTTEVLTSRFNKFAEPIEDEKPLRLDQNSFYALSWMISELGQLKDEGLLHEALHHALMMTIGKTDREAEKRTNELLRGRETGEILQLAQLIVRDYFEGKSLSSLVVG